MSLHAALTPETRRLIGKRELALMRSRAVLVNTARGPLVDTAALVAALGRPSGLRLDVTRNRCPSAIPSSICRTQS